MGRAWLCVILAAVCCGGEWAFGAHGSAVPQQALARATDTGEIELVRQLNQMVYEQRERAVTVYKEVQETISETIDGREVQKTVTKKVPVIQTQTYTVSKPVRIQKANTLGPETANFFEVNGRPVTPEAAVRRLGQQTLVVVTHDGKPVPEHFAWVFKPGTLVVALKPPVAMIAPPPPQIDEAPQPVPQPLPQPASPVPPATRLAPEPRTVLVSQSAPLEPQNAFPASAEPTFVFASLDREGILKFRTMNEYSFSNTIQAEQPAADGTPQTVQFPVDVTNRHTTIVGLPARFVQVMTADGQKVTAQQLPRALPRERTVLAATDGRPIDPFWLQNIQPSVLLVVAPEGAVSMLAGHGGYGASGGYGGSGGYTPASGSALPAQVVPVPAPVPSPQPVPAPAAPEPVVPQPAPPEAREARNQEGFPPAVALSPLEREVLERTNRERTTIGTPPLRFNRQLAEAARGHARNMARQGILNHTLDDRTFDKRIDATGYQLSAAGENISNARSAAEAMTGWMGSPGHRANILNGEFQEVGIGVATGTAGESYWAVVFAKRVDAPGQAAVTVRQGE